MGTACLFTSAHRSSSLEAGDRDDASGGRLHSLYFGYGPDLPSDLATGLLVGCEAYFGWQHRYQNHTSSLQHD